MQDYSLHSLTLLKAQGVIIQWKTYLAWVTTWTQSLVPTGENTVAKTKTDECKHFLSLGLSHAKDLTSSSVQDKGNFGKCYIQLIKEVKGSGTGVRFL